MNRLPLVKAWIKERAPVAFSASVEIKYMGGDPRFVFVNTFEEFCYLDGQVMSIDKVEEISVETKINSFNAEQIEAFLKENGILPNNVSNQQ